MTALAVRAQLRSLMAATSRNEKNWHYHAVRPLTMPTLEAALHGAVVSDCSFGCKILCHLAAAPDPTGDGAGYGNSSSMFRHLPHIPFEQVQNGDCAVFGHVDGEQHAVMIYEKRGTAGVTLVWSHGQEAGPIIVPMSVEIASHPGATVTFLQTLPADPAPQPVRVDVDLNGKPWLVRQNVAGKAVWSRVRQAAAAGKTLRIRRSK